MTARAMITRLFRRRPHQHTGWWWDGFYEHCRCGASAGDRRGPDGHRHILFADWPQEEPVTRTADHDWRGRPYMQLVDRHDPLVVHATFWTSDGLVPAEGDRVILRHAEQQHGACYRVSDVRYDRDGIYGLTARFEARSQAEIAADVAEHGPSKPRPVAL